MLNHSFTLTLQRLASYIRISTKQFVQKKPLLNFNALWENRTCYGIEQGLPHGRKDGEITSSVHATCS